MSYTVRNLAIAAALAFVGLVLATSYISGQRNKITAGQRMTTVLVAKKDIPAGTAASELEDSGYVESQKYKRDDVAPQVLHDLKGLSKLKTNSTVYAGEQLTAHKFETTSSLNPAAQIKGTERWVAVPIGPSGRISQYVHPGDHVDILASGDLKPAGGNSEAVSTTWIVARNVLVVQTPESQLPDGSSSSTSGPPKPGSENALYVLQVSDAVAQNILWSNNTSSTKVNDAGGLQFLLRPSDGDQETKLPAETDLPNAS